MERSCFKNDGDESEGNDGESVEGGAGVSEVNLGALGRSDGLSSSEKFELMKLQLKMQKEMEMQQIQMQKEVEIEKIRAERGIKLI